jgi:hypothetical protein
MLKQREHFTISAVIVLLLIIIVSVWLVDIYSLFEEFGFDTMELKGFENESRIEFFIMDLLI